MKEKTIKIIYWIITILFSLFMIVSGISELMHTKQSDDLFIYLGYPLYLGTILGVTKVLGSIVLLQTKFKTLKEWTYAGFTIDMLGASVSFMFVEGFGFAAIFPLILTGILFVSYACWKKLDR